MPLGGHLEWLYSGYWGQVLPQRSMWLEASKSVARFRSFRFSMTYPSRETGGKEDDVIPTCEEKFIFYHLWFYEGGKYKNRTHVIKDGNKWPIGQMPGKCIDLLYALKLCLLFLLFSGFSVYERLTSGNQIERIPSTSVLWQELENRSCSSVLEHLS